MESRDIQNLELPKNIIKIDGPLKHNFSDKPIMNITYDGTLKEIKKIQGYEFLVSALKPGGKIICSDGEIKRASV